MANDGFIVSCKSKLGRFTYDALRLLDSLFVEDVVRQTDYHTNGQSSFKLLLLYETVQQFTTHVIAVMRYVRSNR